MLVINRVALRQRHFGHRHDLALDLAGAIAKVDLGHIANARRLTPARIADQIFDVEWRAARRARKGMRQIHAATPFTLNALYWVHLFLQCSLAARSRYDLFTC